MKILIVGSDEEKKEQARIINELMAERSIPATIILSEDVPQNNGFANQLSREIITYITPAIKPNRQKHHPFRHKGKG